MVLPRWVQNNRWRQQLELLIKAREESGRVRGATTKQRVIGRIWTNRDLFVRSSFSWYHSNLGAGTAMNWQWNVASSFLNTTTSSGETTGRGKLLSAKTKKKKKADKHSCDYSCKPSDRQVPYVWVLNHYKRSVIKTCQRQRKVVKKSEFIQRWVSTAEMGTEKPS